MNRPITMVYVSADADETVRLRLETHLALLEQQGLMQGWHAERILAGSVQAESWEEALQKASLVLFLISADFFATPLCQTQMQRAQELQQKGRLQVIPILVRPVDGKGTSFTGVQALPRNGQPITSWTDQDAAFKEVAEGIRRVIEEHATVYPPRTREPHVWNIPYARNPFFLGRDDLLTQPHEHLQKGQSIALSQPQAMQYPVVPPLSIFVSHSTLDNDFGIRLVGDLRRVLGNEQAVWYDSQGGLQGGDNWWSKVINEIRTRNVFIVILSAEAMASPWVETEINIAWKQKHEQAGYGKLILPVVYRPCQIRDDLKTLQVISFVSPKSYEEAFAELLLALQTQNALPATITPNALSRHAESLEYGRSELTLPVWNVPYRRNPFFTGREILLRQLHDALSKNTPTALTQAQAISGLGGIGKAQCALEYSYRYREVYRYVLWMRAASREMLLSEFVTLAYLLRLPGQHEQDPYLVVAAVQRWLVTHREWLLILDNADDLAMVDAFLVHADTGQILLTKRDPSMPPVARPIA